MYVSSQLAKRPKLSINLLPMHMMSLQICSCECRQVCGVTSFCSFATHRVRVSTEIAYAQLRHKPFKFMGGTVHAPAPYSTGARAWVRGARELTGTGVDNAICTATEDERCKMKADIFFAFFFLLGTANLDKGKLGK